MTYFLHGCDHILQDSMTLDADIEGDMGVLVTFSGSSIYVLLCYSKYVDVLHIFRY